MPPHPEAECPWSKTGEHLIQEIKPYIEYEYFRKLGAYKPFCVWCGKTNA